MIQALQGQGPAPKTTLKGMKRDPALGDLKLPDGKSEASRKQRFPRKGMAHKSPDPQNFFAPVLVRSFPTFCYLHVVSVAKWGDNVKDRHLGILQLNVFPPARFEPQPVTPGLLGLLGDHGILS